MNPEPNIPGLPPAASRPASVWWMILIGAAVLLGLGILWRVEPAGQPFFPRCWLYQTTGLQCPGCGATRAVHALLNGRLQEAIQLNALLVAALPLALWMAIRWLWGWRTGRWWPNPLVHPWVLALLGGLVFGFGIGRNLGG
ncbi:MAG: DUF2752 domain-containing protein [Verrucomicrobia bacterium]|nr:DUF2752 domain-containing protein [Verrucomicrobiota bacterium]